MPSPKTLAVPSTQQSCWQYLSCTHMKWSWGQIDLPGCTRHHTAGHFWKTLCHPPCLRLLLDIVGRGRWDWWRPLGQDQSTWQVRPSLITDALLGSNLCIQQLILISRENTDKSFLSSAGWRRGFTSGKQPHCSKEIVRPAGWQRIWPCPWSCSVQ